MKAGIDMRIQHVLGGTIALLTIIGTSAATLPSAASAAAAKTTATIAVERSGTKTANRYDYTITVTGAGRVRPAGVVRLGDAKGATCEQKSLNTHGQATCVVTEYPGTYRITARYAGDQRYRPASKTYYMIISRPSLPCVASACMTVATSA
jgi:Bacterial Ig-like domain (group 3)